jgi:hypothetical protein
MVAAISAPRWRQVFLFVAGVLSVVVGDSAGRAASAPTGLSPQEAAAAATDIKPAMDLLLAPVDRIFLDGFE